MNIETLQDAIEEYQEQEKLTRLEGESGVKNLCRIVHAMGYVDKQYFGQFHHAGSYGDLINFLEDNSGAMEAILEWINNQDLPEWKENIESNLYEKDEE